jgi:YidC/Oxa1 family membrane protein insertase
VNGAPSAPGEAKAPESATPAAPAQDLPEAPPIALENGEYRLTLTNKGAGIRELVRKYKGNNVVLLAPHAGVAPHLALKAEGLGDKIQTAGWEVVESGPSSATFRYKTSNGAEIRKTFELPADGGAPKLKLGMSKAPGVEGAVPLKLELFAINGMEHDSEYRYEQYAAGFAQTEKGLELFTVPNVVSGEEKLRAAKSKEEWVEASAHLKAAGNQKAWFGTKNRFFLTALHPDDVTRSRIKEVWFQPVSPSLLPEYQGRKGVMMSAVFDPLTLGTESYAWSFDLKALPLKTSELAALPKGESLLSYGSGCAAGCGPLGFLFAPIVQIVNWVAPLILMVLGGVASVLGNWGVAIILTTLIIRLCLFPLSKKSQVSMYRMQQLGPKIQALRERYKDDQQKFGMEQMRLFREHKINPLSGCLPMLLQMPIFIAMYSVFEMSVDLRERRFLWMELHEPDKLVYWGGQVVVPVVGLHLDAFNLLPIIMTITWFLQSWFAPRSPDPQMAAQQKMMLFMPIVFGLMCYNLASGLSLYFFVNSLLSMGEQKLIKKFFLKPGSGDGPATA